MDETSERPPEWLIDLVREFGPKVIPLDVTPEGTYESMKTRWGMNPIYEAVPKRIRSVAERDAPVSARLYWQRLRTRNPVPGDVPAIGAL